MEGEEGSLEVNTYTLTNNTPLTHRDGNADSFLTLNSPIPADSSDGIGGILTQRVWSRNPREILDHVTRDWRNHYVTAAVLSTDELREFAIRPFVLIVSVDAPILERFRRMTRYRTLSLSSPTVLSFVEERDFEFAGWRNNTSRWRNSSSSTTRRCTGKTCYAPNNTTGVRPSKSWRN
jgi:hypothetical protein